MTPSSRASGSSSHHITDAVIAKKRKRGDVATTKKQPMGLRGPVERTNSCLSNFGQLRRNTDRKIIHRLAKFALAVAFLLTAKLIDWLNRLSPDVCLFAEPLTALSSRNS